jgi:hypothetical protein
VIESSKICVSAARMVISPCSSLAPEPDYGNIYWRPLEFEWFPANGFQQIFGSMDPMVVGNLVEGWYIKTRKTRFFFPR